MSNSKENIEYPAKRTTIPPVEVQVDWTIKSEKNEVLDYNILSPMKGLDCEEEAMGTAFIKSKEDEVRDNNNSLATRNNKSADFTQIIEGSEHSTLKTSPMKDLLDNELPSLPDLKLEPNEIVNIIKAYNKGVKTEINVDSIDMNKYEAYLAIDNSLEFSDVETLTDESFADIDIDMEDVLSILNSTECEGEAMSTAFIKSKEDEVLDNNNSPATKDSKSGDFTQVIESGEHSTLKASPLKGFDCKKEAMGTAIIRSEEDEVSDYNISMRTNDIITDDLDSETDNSFGLEFSNIDEEIVTDVGSVNNEEDLPVSSNAEGGLWSRVSTYFKNFFRRFTDVPKRRHSESDLDSFEKYKPSSFLIRGRRSIHDMSTPQTNDILS